MANEQKVVYLVYREERHYGMNPCGITTRKDWAEKWLKEFGGPTDAMSGPDFDEFILDDPNIFPEARE